MNRLSDEELEKARKFWNLKGNYTAETIQGLISTIDTLKEEAANESRVADSANVVLMERAERLQTEVERLEERIEQHTDCSNCLDLKALLKEKGEEIERLENKNKALNFNIGCVKGFITTLKQKVEEQVTREINRGCEFTEVKRHRDSLQARLSKYEEAVENTPLAAMAALLGNTGHDVYANDLRNLVGLKEGGG